MTPIAPGIGGMAAPPVVLAPAAVILVASVVLVGSRPPVTHRTAFAALPWAAVAAGLDAYASVAAYPPVLRPLFVAPWVYLTVGAIAGAAWVAMLALDSSVRTVPDMSAPLGAAGAGTAAVVLGAVIAGAGTVDPGRLVLLFVLPVIAAAAAVVVYLLFGILDTDTATYTGAAGALVVFAHALDAMATVLGVSSFAVLDDAAVSGAVARAATALELAGRLGIDPTLTWAWLFIWLKLAGAVVAIAALARYVRARPRTGNLLLGLVAAVGAIPATSALLAILMGGAG